MQVLSEETPIGGAVGEAGERWMFVTHVDPARLALLVRAGEEATLPRRRIGRGEQIYLEYGAGHDPIPPGGLDVVIEFQRRWRGPREVFREHLRAFDADSPWTQRAIPLSGLAGQSGSLSVHCGPGPASDEVTEWLAITEFLVCQPEECNLARARMHPERRRRLEDQHFSHVYRLPFFTSSNPNLYSMYNDYVTSLVAPERIDFRARLRRLCERKVVRVLSLCCGGARIEEQRIEGLEDRIELTLMDVNADLLELAAERFGRVRRLDKLVGDANSIRLPRSSFDVVLCVSALHHVVELEHLLDQVARSLAPEGEFWSIGEYIGRSGARLWPESYEVANELFHQIPERLRVNGVAGDGAQVEDDLPNPDSSLLTFEGVRATEIETLLEQRFEVVEARRWNTIAWRLLDSAYIGNYDLDDPDDRAWIARVCDLDVECMESGRLRPVMLDGVFRSRRPVG